MASKISEQPNSPSQKETDEIPEGEPAPFSCHRGLGLLVVLATLTSCAKRPSSRRGRQPPLGLFYALCFQARIVISGRAPAHLFQASVRRRPDQHLEQRAGAAMHVRGSDPPNRGSVTCRREHPPNMGGSWGIACFQIWARTTGFSVLSEQFGGAPGSTLLERPDREGDASSDGRAQHPPTG